ncbi:recombination protein NinG [Klebsiella pneumoniae]
MTTDITELALIDKIQKQLENFDTVVLKEDEANALVEALEKAQRANAAQDDHINQQQYRVALVEKIGAERVEALENNNTPHRYTIEELEGIRRHYSALRRALIKQREAA